MAGFTGAPPIVTDGLVFAVDAANYESYPGSGTTITDLVSNTTGTLTNGPTYSSNNSGLIVCDGTNDYINFDSFESYVPTTEGTFNTFVRITDLTITSGEKFIMQYEISNSDQINIQLRYNSNPYLWFRHKAGGTAKNISNSTSNYSTSQFYMLSLTYSVTNDRFRAYVNGQQLGSDGSSLGTWAGGTANFHFGGHNGSSTCPIELAQGSVYNRELSASELLQNYNALKSRFNL